MKKPRESTCNHSGIFVLASQSGTAMLLVLVLSVIGGILLSSLMMTSKMTSQKSGHRRGKVSALNIAEAGKERFFAKFLHESYIPQPNMTDLIFDNIGLGNGNYTVRCITGTSIDTVTVRARGDENGNTLEIEVVAVKERDVPLGGMSGRMPAALTARGTVDLLGTINVDGRDHDSLNSVTGPGTYGVHTCDSLLMSSTAATVGGNALAPVNRDTIDGVRTIVCRENASVEPNMSSPEAFMGLPPGSLDSYKITASEFTIPFEGLVYVTESIGPVQLGNSRGILIVHNDAGTASIFANGGDFKGLIICDYVLRINGIVNITGAIVALSDSDVSNFGNGTANIYYSQQVLDNLVEYSRNVPWKISELSWKELP